MQEKPRLFGVDIAARSREFFLYDDAEKQFQIVTQQDVGPVLAENQAQRNDAPMQFNEKSGLTKVASIPNVVLIALREKGILANERTFKKWLNDPENKVFRTRGGRV